MNNKWFLYVVIVFILSSCSYFGQKDREWSPENMAKRQTEMMTDLLELSEEQVKEVDEINLKFAKQFAEARKSAKGDREEMRKLMRELQVIKNEAFKEVLSAEQIEQYQEFENNRRHKRMRNEPKRPSEER